MCVLTLKFLSLAPSYNRRPSKLCVVVCFKKEKKKVWLSGASSEQALALDNWDMLYENKEDI